MTRRYIRYNKDDLEQVVKNSFSFADVARHYGKSPVGGTITNIKLMCDRWGIDYSHMTGQAHNKGVPSNKKTPAHIRLVMGSPMDHRIGASRLRQSLFEIGIPHKCNVCEMGPEWNGKELVLEIDHIDDQYWNNTPDNLQFLCPNCHTQKTKGL